MYNKFPHIVLRLTLMYWCLNYTYYESFLVTIKRSHLNVNNFIGIGTGRWNRTTDIPLSGECYNLLNYTSLEVQMGIEPTFIGLMRPLHYLICD